MYVCFSLNSALSATVVGVEVGSNTSATFWVLVSGMVSTLPIIQLFLVLDNGNWRGVMLYASLEVGSRAASTS
jgi:hypothetical protein